MHFLFHLFVRGKVPDGFHANTFPNFENWFQFHQSLVCPSKSSKFDSLKWFSLVLLRISWNAAKSIDVICIGTLFQFFLLQNGILQFKVYCSWNKFKQNYRNNFFSTWWISAGYLYKMYWMRHSLRMTLHFNGGYFYWMSILCANPLKESTDIVRFHFHFDFVCSVSSSSSYFPLSKWFC